MKQSAQQSSYYLELATRDDWGDVLRLSKDFHEESPYREIPFSEGRVRSLFEGYLAGNGEEFTTILLKIRGESVGIIVALLSPLPFSDVLVAQELIWFVSPEHRNKKGSLLLFGAFEFWAKKVNAGFTSVVSTEGTTQLDKFYERSGYYKAETTYVKGF